QAELGLSDLGLGVALVGMAAGALVASPGAGRLVGRVGSRPVAVGAALLLAGCLWTASAAGHPVVLFAALALVGGADATMDIAMNANGAAFERRAGRSVMHRLHGAWSLGALAGAGVAAASAGAGLPLTAQLVLVGVVIAAGVVLARPGLVTGDVTTADRSDGRDGIDRIDEIDGPGGTGRTGSSGTAAGRASHRLAAPLAVLALATVGGAIVEGAPADWSAIRLERLGTGPGPAALGFAAFMAGMLAGRLVGDHLTDRHGGAAVLRAGMVLVAAGLGAGAVLDHPAVFAVGLVLAGVGASAFFPLAFSAAGRTPRVAPGAGAATVSLAARLGFLLEPLAVGAVAQAVGLRWAFVAVAGVALALAAAATRVVPPGARPGPAPVTDVREP
ncbi:MAG TPA: MFS transporter, partial [Acidimicrobiales bacterium]|nr:MFS transporter [Acidimicrobiales bacterium]